MLQYTVLPIDVSVFCTLSFVVNDFLDELQFAFFFFHQTFFNSTVISLIIYVSVSSQLFCFMFHQAVPPLKNAGVAKCFSSSVFLLLPDVSMSGDYLSSSARARLRGCKVEAVNISTLQNSQKCTVSEAGGAAQTLKLRQFSLAAFNPSVAVLESMCHM